MFCMCVVMLSTCVVMLSMCCYAFHVLLCFPYVLCFPCSFVKFSGHFRRITLHSRKSWWNGNLHTRYRTTESPPFTKLVKVTPVLFLLHETVDTCRQFRFCRFCRSSWFFLSSYWWGGILTAANLWTQAQLVETLDCHSPHAIHCLTTGLDGARPVLCSGASDCRVSVRDAQDGLLLKMFKGHTKTVNAVQVRAVCSFLTIPPIAGTPVFTQSCGFGRRRSIMTQYTLHGLSSGVSKLFCQRATLLTEMRFVRGCYLQKSMLLNVTYLMLLTEMLLTEIRGPRYLLTEMRFVRGPRPLSEGHVTYIMWLFRDLLHCTK